MKSPNQLTETAPEKIRLHVSDDENDLQRDFRSITATSEDGVTWVEGSAGGAEVEYVRADMLDAIAAAQIRTIQSEAAFLRRELEQLIRVRDELRHENVTALATARDAKQQASRRQLWTSVVTGVASAIGCTDPQVAATWADKALERFDRRFPAVN